MLALAGGVLLFWQRLLIAKAQSTFPTVLEAEEAYQRTMRAVDRLAVEVTAVTQRGSLPLYLGSILLVVIVLPGGALLVLRDWPSGVRLFDTPAQLLVGVIMAAAAFLAATSRGRLRAVMLAGVTGYGVAVLFLLHGAPDLALTQILVETVTLVVFALVLRKLPKYFTSRPLQATPLVAAGGRHHRRHRRVDWSAWPRPARGSPCRSRRPSTRRRTRSATATTSSTSRWSTSGPGTPWARSPCWWSRPPAWPA